MLLGAVAEAAHNPRPSVVWQQIIVKDVWQRPSLLGKVLSGEWVPFLPVSFSLRADSHASLGPGAVVRESREVHSVRFELAPTQGDVGYWFPILITHFCH